ncbi:MAG: GNAT family N-acetyltransferase [Faecousia sp.]
MLLVVRKMNEFSFSKLMQVYLDANREHGAFLAPEEPEDRQILLSEEDFYSYLHDSFFAHPGAMYCVWEESGQYISALRLEPYSDGLLLEALETAPGERRKGYAVRLIQAVQQMLEQLGSVRLYSHVSKRNEASLKTHYACGFQVFQDYAAYIDGSVNNRAYTLRYEKNFSQFEKKN